MPEDDEATNRRPHKAHTPPRFDWIRAEAPRAEDIQAQAEFDEFDRALNRKLATAGIAGFVIAIPPGLMLLDLAFNPGSHLREAVSTWLSGRSASSLPLWGKSVLFWARVGKIAQFLAGLTVVLDIVGTNRLRRVNERVAAGREEWARRFHKLENRRVKLTLELVGAFLSLMGHRASGCNYDYGRVG